jgi:hypothetical protein
MAFLMVISHPKIVYPLLINWEKMLVHNRVGVRRKTAGSQISGFTIGRNLKFIRRCASHLGHENRSKLREWHYVAGQAQRA